MKTSELIGPALDWAVAKCEGHSWRKGETGYQYTPAKTSCWQQWAPSINWAQGGPILSNLRGLELKHWLESSKGTLYEAHIHNYEGDWITFGSTALIAVMRCYVASKLGDEVEVPKELV